MGAQGGLGGAMTEPPPLPPTEQLKLRQDGRHYCYLNRESSGLPGVDDAANFHAVQVPPAGAWEDGKP